MFKMLQMRRSAIIIVVMLILTSCGGKSENSNEVVDAIISSDKSVNEGEENIEQVDTTTDNQPKALLIIGNEFGNTYFDMKEALEALDFIVETVGVDKGTLLNSCPNHENIEVSPDFSIEEITGELLKAYSVVFIPSGKHHRTLPYSDEVERVLNLCMDHEVFIASVCAGNIVLASFEGLIDGHDIACNSSTRDAIAKANGVPKYNSVVIDGLFITGDVGGGKGGGGHEAAPIQEMAEVINEAIREKESRTSASTIEGVDYEAIDETLESLSELNNMLFVTVIEGETVTKERFYNSYQSGQKNNVFSVTKSITSMLVGIAIEEGYIESVEQTIDEFIDVDYYGLTKEQQQITIENLLTMTMGLEWNTGDLGAEYAVLKSSKEPLFGVFDREFTYDPGTTFLYSDGAAHTMSNVFTAATGRSLLDYATEKILEPLDITDVRWDEDRLGNNYGGFDLYLSSEDMGKIGIMVKAGGMYNGQQIVPGKWLLTSTRKKVTTSSTREYNNEYGYYWWLGNVEDVEMFAAVGHGGQFIYVVPELDIVIVAGATGAVSNDISYKSFVDIQAAIVNEIIPIYIEAFISEN